MGLRDNRIKIEYRVPNDNVVQEFYLPMLSRAVSYCRAVGYFRSSSLVEISKGISGLVKNGGKIRIVASPYLDEDDIKAIQEGYETREAVVERALLKGLETENRDYFTMQRLNLLASLIADGILEIHIAYTVNHNGVGLYHEKLGVIEDEAGDYVAFSGSNNETSSAMYLNYETIDVFKSWGEQDETKRAEVKRNAFEKIWANLDPAVKVLDFPNVTQALIDQYKVSPVNYEIDVEQFGTVSKGTLAEKRPAPVGARIPVDVELREYQKEAISSWVSENYKGIFDMATGTGKTYTGLGAIAKLSEDMDDNLAVIVVAPYQHLVDQWVEDIVRFNITPVIGYSSSPQKDWKQRLEKAIRDQKIRNDKSFFLFVTTNATFASKYVQEQIGKIRKPILLVVDEAHNFGARTYAKLLDSRFKYRLALSATLERHRDVEGTQILYDFFGRKCIEYPLGRAIAEGKLTRYKYHPILVYLNKAELHTYEELSFQIAKEVIIGKNGRIKLTRYGDILAIKRSRVIAAAIEKMYRLEEVIQEYKEANNILVYCGATNIMSDESDVSDTDASDLRQIEAVVSLLGNKLGMKVSRFTSEETAEERQAIKEHFQNGEDLQAIVAIKCLDEGVNIPGIKTAFILASSTNPKEYIQRRGRVLRKAPGKEYAEIYDFITLPRPLDEVSGLTIEQAQRDLSLVKRELSRVKEFAELSDNKMDGMQLVWNICDTYGLSYDDEEEFENE